jgi:hypothetical protein
MSDLGLLTYYLGIENCHDSFEISLCQKSYARRLLEKMAMSDCTPCLSLMETRLKLTKTGTEAQVDATQYQSVIGALRHLIHTRLDLMNSVSYVTRFMSEPHEGHQAAVKWILRYIASMQNYGI